MRYVSSLPFYVAALGCVTLLGVGCAMNSPAPVVHNNNPPVPVATTTIALPNYPETAPTVRPRPTDNVCDPQNFICVPSSLVYSHLQSPVHASGTAIAFENTFQWMLLGPADQDIAHGTLMAASPDIGQPGPFNLSQAATIPNSYASGTLRFYEASAKDGSPIHTLNIPVTF